MKHSMQIGRHFLESQIVIAVAVCAAPFVEVLPFDLLGGELWRQTADGEIATGDEREAAKQCEAKNKSPSRH
jgi:hypothetical protein